jgi:hypothetical protein
LGVEPYIDGPYYVGYKVGDVEIGLDPNAQNAEPVTYIDVADIKSSLQEMIALGATLLQDVKNVGSGLLIASVKDIDGNILGFRQKTRKDKSEERIKRNQRKMYLARLSSYTDQ